MVEYGNNKLSEKLLRLGLPVQPLSVFTNPEELPRAIGIELYDHCRENIESLAGDSHRFC